MGIGFSTGWQCSDVFETLVVEVSLNTLIDVQIGNRNGFQSLKHYKAKVGSTGAS